MKEGLFLFVNRTAEARVVGPKSSPVFVARQNHRLMSFVSAQYLCFLTLMVALYWRLPDRGRIWLLLIASCVFYGAWDIRFLALLGASSVIDFFCGLAIHGQHRPLRQVIGLSGIPLLALGGCALNLTGKATIPAGAMEAAGSFFLVFPTLYALLIRGPAPRMEKAFFVLSITSNLAVLCFFKYYGFFAETLVQLARKMGSDPGPILFQVTLPIAISFYTFQSICYTTDIYKKRARPIGDFATFSAYLCFFPQLVAGPIERPSHLVPQFEGRHRFHIEDFHQGIRLILMGFFKKIFVADNCAILANYVFDPKTSLNAPWALLGAAAFAYQIYGDFSGYTDIARGSARLFGFRLSQNFLFPYFAKGPSDFWRRWHITLSSWFRDYVYIPLGGNRAAGWRVNCNLFLTMLAAGFWHGASWMFLIWGAFHGAVLVLYRGVPALGRLEKSRTGWQSACALALMLCVTCVGWVIFRSPDFPTCLAWFGSLGVWTSSAVPWKPPFFWLLLHCIPLLLLQFATRHRKGEYDFPPAWHWSLRGAVYALLFLTIASSAISDKEFLYFQF